jgi:hypothetical protein
MSLILGHKKRKLIRDITIKDSAGDTVTPGTNDVVRIKIGRVRQVPILDLDSAAASANGSTVTKNSPSTGVNRVAIHQDDMDQLSPGVYTFEVSLVDNADSQAIKHVDSQILFVRGVPLGDVGLT